jgi:spermidine synthase
MGTVMARARRSRQGKVAARSVGLWSPLGVAFLAGWVVMMLEILGGRLLAPYFGYSVYQWGALIGVVLTCLTCGYYLGGQVGDRAFARGFLLWALIVSAGWILLVPIMAPGWLIQCRHSGPAWGAVLASGLLLGPPSVLLGTVCPIIIRLTFTNRVANAAGRVYAVSTLGSIGGTFFATFYAIPELGTRVSHYVAGVLVVLAVAILALAGKQPRYLAALGLLLLAALPPDSRIPSGVIYHGESVHNIIRVVDGVSRRSLYLNYGAGAQTVMRKDQLLTGDYYDYFAAGPLLNRAKSVLFLGVAGGTSLKQLVTIYPEVDVVGVELDPAVLAIAKSHFDLASSPRLHLRAEDARWYIETTEKRFDLIAIDLFVTGHVPFFVTTREFFAQVEERLTAGGVMMIHVRSVRPGQELLGPFIRTLRSVFPSVFVFGRGNFMLVASKTSVQRDHLVGALEEGAIRFPQLKEVVARIVPGLEVATAGAEWPIFTDDRNDVEFRTFRMCFQPNEPRGR